MNESACLSLSLSLRLPSSFFPFTLSLHLFTSSPLHLFISSKLSPISSLLFSPLISSSSLYPSLAILIQAPDASPRLRGCPRFNDPSPSFFASSGGILSLCLSPNSRHSPVVSFLFSDPGHFLNPSRGYIWVFEIRPDFLFSCRYVWIPRWAGWLTRSWLFLGGGSWLEPLPSRISRISRTQRKPIHGCLQFI